MNIFKRDRLIDHAHRPRFSIALVAAAVILTVALPTQLFAQASQILVIDAPDAWGDTRFYTNGNFFGMKTATDSFTGMGVGHTVTLIATPAPGREFESWDDSGSTVSVIVDPLDPNPTFAIPGGADSILIQGKYRSPTFELIVDTTGGGSVDPSGTNYIAQFTQRAISAFPGAGFMFFAWTNASGVADEYSRNTLITMDGDKEVWADFRTERTIFQSANAGPGSSNITKVVDGRTNYVVRIWQLYQPGAPGTRYKFTGWRNGSGDIPANGVMPSFSIPTVSGNSTIEWTWKQQYSLDIPSNSVGGSTTYDGRSWHDTGTNVIIGAIPDAGFIFLQWSVDASGNANPYTLTMDSAKTVVPMFIEIGADSDGDGLPDKWEDRFGLDPQDNGSVVFDYGGQGDPDRDGLNNRAEFFIALTNRDLFCSPINADTDGDGMDDYFEAYFIKETDLEDDEEFVPSAVDNGNLRPANGPLGNLDGDSHWDTDSGYLVTNLALNNYQEWIGPDSIAPVIYITLNAGDAGYPFPTNGLNPTPPVTIMINNVADTGDQSRPNDDDTDKDGFDDGFEWSWDQWQQAHQGDDIANTNWWVAITNTVPVWDGAVNATRRFNPANMHPEPVGAWYPTAYPDWDYWYNQINGQSSDPGTSYSYPYSDADEYMASEFASGDDSTTLYPFDRLFPPPGNPPWCTNPFMWDTDGDGLPDGWEISFGYDPWDYDSDDDGTGDGLENPDGDWYARIDPSNEHFVVYQTLGFHPSTAYFYLDEPTPDYKKLGPNTVRYRNIDELRGSLSIYAFDLTITNRTPTHPFMIDTDNDGMWDGWEWYVGLNPRSFSDPNGPDDGLDKDLPGPPGDGLSNLDEFRSYATSTNDFTARVYLPEWQNKLRPTDPWDKDTDRDQLWDGRERAEFNYNDGNGTMNSMLDTNTGEITYIYFSGAGLNPCSVDTDADFLPDGWEAVFSGTGNDSNWVAGMNGTMPDAHDDPDGDGLVNYQEYMAGAVYHWRYLNNDGSPAWTPNRGIGNYEPYDFFDPDLSSNEWFTAGGGREPYTWDGRYIVGPDYHPVPFRFMTAVETLDHLYYKTLDPTEDDSDEDGMDDYWEIYHGLNPMFGVVDIAAGTVAPELVIPGMMPWDFVSFPYVSGHPMIDADQDELPNIYETVQQNSDDPPYYHTDPSPYWMTDTSSTQSWVNLYYTLGDRFGGWSFDIAEANWYWGPGVLELVTFAPTYLFDFECNEGFDTDNDNISDRAELITDPSVAPGASDPINSGMPIKRRALYLDGNSAVRTRIAHMHLAEEFRTFTIEMWVRPQDPATGQEQILIEKSAIVPVQNIMGIPAGRRCNFKMGLDGTGRPFISYNGAGHNLFFVEAKAASASAFTSNRWYHIAATYGGEMEESGFWSGLLTLYVDGEIKSAVPSSEIPFNGWYGSLSVPTNDILEVQIGYYSPMPIVIGAGDDNPAGAVDGGVILVGEAAGASYGQPDLLDYYQGWIDEVRIWHGARKKEDILADMDKRYTRDDVAAAVPDERLAATNDVTGLVILRYFYGFDDLPDPDHHPVSPDGLSLVASFPPGYVAVPWWVSASDVSTVYDDYFYVPWIENLVPHVPLTTPRDTTIEHVPGTNDFPNTANPYGFVYRHAPTMGGEFHPHMDYPGLYEGFDHMRNPHYNDALPLRNAVADEDIPMWDGGGIPAIDPFDSDGDGMPDDWETANGLDLLVADGDDGAYGDVDGDGLYNLFEYLSGLNPQSVDTDGDGLNDSEEDSDGDGVGNLAEQDIYGTHPNRTDTDDDGLFDGEETFGGTDPASSVSPYVMRALRFGATNGAVREVRVGDVAAGDGTSQFDLSTEWTIELLVQPYALPGAGIRCPLLLREIPTETGTNINYELGMQDAGRPYVRFQIQGTTNFTEVVGGGIFPTNAWTHVAGKFDDGVLTLLVDGSIVGSIPVAGLACSGDGELIFGCNMFNGEMKEMRIWKIARSVSDIDQLKERNLLFGATSADDGMLAVDGSGYLMETATTLQEDGSFIDELDVWTLETWIRVPQGNSGVLIARENLNNFNGEDYNYNLSIQDTGELIGTFACVYFRMDGSVVINTFINAVRGARRVDDGEWHHVAFVRSNDGIFLYVDGMLDSRSSAAVYLASDSPINFGSWRVRSAGGPVIIGRGITGEMDEIRVWNRPLSEALINKYSKENLLGTELGLIMYFNFDYQLGENADERSALRESTERGVYIDGAERLETAGDGPPINLIPLRSYAGTALVGYFTCDDGGNATSGDAGGNSVEDFMWADGWWDDWAHAGVIAGDVTFVAVSNNIFPLMQDGDADGLPSWWETLYRLDPGVDNGINGAWGDPDEDGLNNFAEFLAGTNPRDFDSDNDGFGDYDSGADPADGGQAYGELYTDGDGIPDLWESKYMGNALGTGNPGLDPLHYDAADDPDADGWDNFAEYMGSWDNSNTLVRSSDPLDPAEYPEPLMDIHLRYSGTLGSSLDSIIGDPVVHIDFYTTSEMGGYPDASIEVSGTDVSTNEMDEGHIRQGTNYIFAYIDVDGSGEWDPVNEPAGIAEPIYVGWDNVNNIKIGLTDRLSGYPRFGWEAIPGIDQYIIKLMRGTTKVFERTVGRTYVHEADYLLEGIYGLSNGTYNAQIYFMDNVFGSYFTNFHTVEIMIIDPVAMPTTTFVTGNDYIYQHAFNEVTWNISSGDATAYTLEVATNAAFANILATRTYSSALVYREANGNCRAPLPFYAGDDNGAGGVWSNGRYFVRLMPIVPGAASTWVGPIAFQLNLLQPSRGGKSMISGDLFYFGKVSRAFGQPNGTLIVQTYSSPGFSGVPDAQVEFAYVSDTNAPLASKGFYELMGLHSSPQYVRAFLDVNGNGIFDSFEAWGFAKEGDVDPNDYHTRKIDLTGATSLGVSGIDIVIRDRDTDNDMLPDGWEYMNWGNLAQGSLDDFDNDGLTNLEEFRESRMDTDPTNPDTDGDGLLDGFEVMNGLNPHVSDTDGDGLSDFYEVNNGLDPLDRDGDSDGDGSSDADEVLYALTDPNDRFDVLSILSTEIEKPTERIGLRWPGVVGVTYQVQYSKNLMTWSDLPGAVFVGSGIHEFYDNSSATDGSRYYRVVIR